MYIYGLLLNLGVKLRLTDVEVATAEKELVCKQNKKWTTYIYLFTIYLAMKKEDGNNGRL